MCVRSQIQQRGKTSAMHPEAITLTQVVLDPNQYSLEPSGGTVPSSNRVTGSRKETTVARRRYQKGSVVLKGNNWTGRYLEDIRMPDGSLRRVHRRVVLGDQHEIRTAKMAWRKLEPFLAPINSTSYRPRTTITLREFAARWE